MKRFLCPKCENEVSRPEVGVAKVRCPHCDAKLNFSKTPRRRSKKNRDSESTTQTGSADPGTKASSGPLDSIFEMNTDEFESSFLKETNTPPVEEEPKPKEKPIAKEKASVETKPTATPEPEDGRSTNDHPSSEEPQASVPPPSQSETRAPERTDTTYYAPETGFVLVDDSKKKPVWLIVACAVAIVILVPVLIAIVIAAQQNENLSNTTDKTSTESDQVQTPADDDSQESSNPHNVVDPQNDEAASADRNESADHGVKQDEDSTDQASINEPPDDADPDIPNPGVGRAAIVQRVKKATCLVVTDDGTGSGFCIDPRGLFVTNAHVVKELDLFETVQIVLDSGEKDAREVTARVARMDLSRDLAFLTTNEPGEFDFIELGDPLQLVETDPLIAFGFPFGKALTVRGGNTPSISVNPGHVTSLRKVDGELKLIQTDAQVNPGNSGGPIVDANGDVVGVVASGFQNAGVHFALPANLIEDLLKEPVVQIQFPAYFTLASIRRPFKGTVVVHNDDWRDVQVKCRIEIRAELHMASLGGGRFQQTFDVSEAADSGDRNVSFIVQVSGETSQGRPVLETVKFEIPVRSRDAVAMVDPGKGNGPQLDIGIDDVEEIVKPSVISLPGPVTDACAGRGGDLLFALIPTEQKIAVIDLAQSQVTKLISIESQDVLMTAGKNDLLVGIPNEDKVLRYDLENFEQTRSARMRMKLPMSSLTLGANSEGPALVTAGYEAREFHAQFIDPSNLNRLRVEFQQVASSGMELQRGGARASVNGNVFVLNGQHRLTVLKVNQSAVKHYSTRASYSNYLTVTPDGSQLITAEGAIPVEVDPNQTIDSRGRSSRETELIVPGLDAGFFLKVFQIRDYRQSESAIGLFLEGLELPLAIVPNTNDIVGEDIRRFATLAIDRRLFLSKAHKKLVLIANNEVQIYDLDLEKLLDQMPEDFLVVTTEPTVQATVDEEYSYQIEVISNGEDISYLLIESPDGMTVDETTGQINWTPDSTQGNQSFKVTVSIMNDDRKQVFHNFEIFVVRP